MTALKSILGPGRFTTLHDEPEVSKLTYGMDFREPRYRRETFLRFYEFHLRYGSHPGGVYFLLPHLAKTEGWDLEAKLWFAYINGNTQNPITSWLIFREFPSIQKLDSFKLKSWFELHYTKLAFDTDRRYFKKSFLDCVDNYRALLRGGTQADFFGPYTKGGPRETFRLLWPLVNRNYIYFGRLSVFSYLEYLAISGLPVECDQLFLTDLAGSKSHRNGLCKVLGRDDLDWHASNPVFTGNYSSEMMQWLTEEGTKLLGDATHRMRRAPYAKDVGYFTLESALCTYKSWHRPNRRYPNVYSDLMVDRIQLAECSWGPLPVFWEARRHKLKPELLLEDNPADCGVKATKQNHYRLTGQPVMMHTDWDCFKNDFNDDVNKRQR